MLHLESQLTVDGLSGREITDFLLEPRDDRYQAWWPGVHRAFHVAKRGLSQSHLGDVVFMDEVVGPRRVRMAGEVVQVVPGEKVVWRMRLWRLRMPVRVSLALRTRGTGVRLNHLIEAGWSGRARVLDPLWRLYFSSSFADSMDRHVRTEFPLLRDLLHGPCWGRASNQEGAAAPRPLAVDGQLP